LDFSRPVAIMLMGILGHIGNPEDDDRAAQSVVGTLRAALPSGGYLAIYDTSDTDPGQNAALRDYNESGAAPYRVRRPDQIVRFFGGLQLVDPGWCRSSSGALTTHRPARPKAWSTWAVSGSKPYLRSRFGGRHRLRP
jgi:hypothetical protein